MEKLNENKTLIGFDNVVYDLEKGEFRDGKPDDYISLSVKYNYEFKQSNKMNELIKFIEDIQPNEKEREYLLKFLSLSISGINEEELFHVFTGVSSNGKSKIRDLLKYTLGEYFATLDSSILTSETLSGDKPNPEILALKGKRLIVASEPAHNKKIQGETMKLLTGNDILTGRYLFSNDKISFYPHFKIILLCNDIPEMSHNDKGIWRRCRIVDFPSIFCSNPTKRNEKQIDKTLSTKIKEWKQDFMLLLLEYYQKYKIEGLKPTPKILRATQEYKNDQNIYLQFLNEMTEKDSKQHIHMKVLYDVYKPWHVTNFPTTKLSSKNVFIKEIHKITLVKPVKINNYTLKGLPHRILKTSEDTSDTE